MTHKWLKAQEQEADFWGNCVNTLGEELKQLVYAKYMGIKFNHDGNTPFNIFGNMNILDIGGGPCSLLLKVKSTGFSNMRTVVDPCKYPIWVFDRYTAARITFLPIKGEDIKAINLYDEVWIYNVLSHTDDPKQVIENAKIAGKTLRIFEWLEDRQNEAHIHSITKENLDNWIGGEGNIVTLNGESECYGKAYYGVFEF